MVPQQPCLRLGALRGCCQQQCCGHSGFVGRGIPAVVCSQAFPHLAACCWECVFLWQSCLFQPGSSCLLVAGIWGSEHLACLGLMVLVIVSSAGSLGRLMVCVLLVVAQPWPTARTARLWVTMGNGLPAPERGCRPPAAPASHHVLALPFPTPSLSAGSGWFAPAAAATTSGACGRRGSFPSLQSSWGQARSCHVASARLRLHVLSLCFPAGLEVILLCSCRISARLQHC